MDAVALVLAVLLAADAESPAVAPSPERLPPPNLASFGIGIRQWPALEGSVWVDPALNGSPTATFGGTGPLMAFGYRRDVGGVGPARVQLGATFALLYEEASLGTAQIIGGPRIGRNVTSRMMYLTADVRLQRTAGRWRPFVEAGIGWYEEDVSTQLSDGMVENTHFRADRLGGWIGVGFDVAILEYATWDLRLSLGGRVHLVDFGTVGSHLVGGGSLGGPIYELVPAVVVGF